jgi:hypothetical protein
MAEVIDLEKIWCNQKIESIGKTIDWILNAPKILDKYDFNKKYPTLVAILLRSNNRLWDDIDETTQYARVFTKKIDINEEKKKLEEKKLELDNLVEKDDVDKEIYSLIEADLKYFDEHYNNETGEITLYKDLKQDYSNLDLIKFFVEHAENIYNLIQNLEDKFLDDEQMFAIYFTKLFAYNMNGVIPKIEDNQIIMQTL